MPPPGEPLAHHDLRLAIRHEAQHLSAVLARGTAGCAACSHEIYLTHMLVILGMMPLITASKPGSVSLAVWYVALLLSSVGLGWVVHPPFRSP